MAGSERQTEKHRSWIERCFSSPRAVEGVLFLLCLLPGGIFLFSQGFYWDDWSQLFLHTKFGDAAFWQYFSSDRPTSAWTTQLLFPVLKDDPLVWHISIILLKYLITIAFYKLCRMVWPADERRNLCFALLFALCPIFTQQYISVAYTQHYLDFLLFLCSAITLLQAAEAPKASFRIFPLIISLTATMLHLSITEYFAPLELIKLPLLYLFFRNRSRERKISLRLSLPYFSAPLGIFILFCVYRLNFDKIFPILEADQPSGLFAPGGSPVDGFVSLVKNMSIDLGYIFVNFSGKLFTWDLTKILAPSTLLFLLLSAAIGLTSYQLIRQDAYLSDVSGGEAEHRSDPDDETPPKTPYQEGKLLPLLSCALLWILLAVLPFWIIGENYLQTSDPPHADRCFLAASPAVVLIWVSLLLWLVRPEHQKLAVSLTAGIFAFSLFQINNSARWNTEEQNDFYQQLAVRVPGIQDDTALVDDDVIFPSQGNFSTASALNVLYPNPIQENGNVPLWIFGYESRPFEEHGGFQMQKRLYHFSAPPENMIYLDHNNAFANCVWIFSPEDVDNPHVSSFQRSWIEHSNIDRILTDAVLVPDSKIFGTAEDTWCMRYQRAALLVQQENWEALTALAENTLAAGFTPNDTRSNSPFEWWPFIAAFLHDGRRDQAQSLADLALAEDPAYQEFFNRRMNSFE